MKVILAAALLAGCCVLVASQENAQTRIPDSLLDCYRNTSLYHREFRPPMSIATLIELIRKVETYPGTNMDMRLLAISLLHRFRLDGIEMNTEVASIEGVVPFSVKGYQFFKHRILLRSFMQGSAVQFPNASLNALELCTMHFLISNSIDKGERGDEGRVCNQISSYQDARRAPRSVPNDSMAQLPAVLNQDQVSVDSSAVPDTQVEVLNPQSLGELISKKGNMFLDNDDNADRAFKPIKPKISQPSFSPFMPSGQPRGQPSGQPSGQPRATNAVPESECPVENGAIYTPYGTVMAGTLLAGIAAGLQPDNVNAKLLNPRASKNIDVQNIWAATLAGDLAEATLLQGPRYGDSIKIGMSGGWNSTYVPRWYFTRNEIGKYQDQMTDAEIRGGLDGLIIAKNIQNWNSVAGNRLKLSQILDMYYSQGGVYEDPKYRACARKELFTEVASTQDMELQTEGFALILDPQMINEAYLDEAAIKRFSVESVKKLTNYIPSSLPSTPCPDMLRSRLTDGVRVKPTIDLYVVIDTTWEFKDVQAFLAGIATKLTLGVYESNMTIIAGKNKQTMLNSSNSFTDFTANFNNSMYDRSVYPTGLDVPGALETELREMFEYKLDLERQRSVAGGKSTVVLFLPYMGHSLNDNDQDVAQEAYKYFSERIPDVKFMYMAQGSKDRYTYLVDDPTKDIFTLTVGSTAESIDVSVDPFIKRMTEMHHRLTNPVCGFTWETLSYSSHGITEYLQPKTTSYYRLHPNYFFTTGYTKIRIQGYGHGDLKVCQSRRNEYPNNATTDSSDITCQQLRSDTREITMDNPCEGYSFVSQCPALYLAIEDVSTSVTPMCFDNECPLPHSIKYTITHEGLTCTAGVGRFLSSPTLLALAAILVAVFKSRTSS